DAGEGVPWARALPAGPRASALASVTSAFMITPPSKPISTLDDSVSATGHPLREDAVNGVWMNKGNLHAVEAQARLCVDQLGPRRLELAQHCRHVADLVCDVVHSRPAVRDETPNGCVVAHRLEKTDAIAAHQHGRRRDTPV